MSRKRLLSTVALLAALSLVVAACGQKSGVSGLATSSGGDAAIDGGDDAALEVGEVTADGKVVVGFDEQGNAILADAGSAEAQAVLGAAKGPTAKKGPIGGPTATTAPPSGVAPTTKVWGPTITIGIHAPITGAAPLPSSFQAAADFVRDYFNEKGGIHGRKLEIVIVDDQYQPAVAAQRCSELVKQRNAFLLIGAAGTDQIQACARNAAGAGVPYLSAGVTERGLTTLKNYFAISMSYKAQVPYLVKHMKATWPQRTGNPKKVWMVYSDTPNFQDAVTAWDAAFPGAEKLKLSRAPSQGELNQAAAKLCDPTNAAQMVFPLMAPANWLFLLGQTTCNPQWAGIGVTMGVNEVAKNACRTSGAKFKGSVFFSPFPGEDTIRGETPYWAGKPPMDPEFKAKVGSRKWDDIWLALWGTTKGMIEILNRTGPELTRAKFVTTMENTTGLATGLSPVLNYSPSNHFGANEVHVLEATCTGEPMPGIGNTQSGSYVTAKPFLKY